MFKCVYIYIEPINEKSKMTTDIMSGMNFDSEGRAYFPSHELALYDLADSMRPTEQIGRTVLAAALEEKRAVESNWSQFGSKVRTSLAPLAYTGGARFSLMPRAPSTPGVPPRGLTAPQFRLGSQMR